MENRTRFRVQVLGSFSLYRDDRIVETDKWQRRSETLFKLLVTAPEHRRLRDELIEILWPEAAPDAGAGNLRIVVHRLRQALIEPPDAGSSPTGSDTGELSPVVSERGWVMLNPAFCWEVDLDRFEALIQTAGGDLDVLLEAAALYRGEPLPEERYEDWAAPIRDRVRRLWRGLALELGAAYQAHADFDSAALWFDRMLEEDPLDEEALRGLLTVLDVAGRRAEALRRYAQFERQLQEEVAAAPSAETMAVVARLRAAQIETAAASIPLAGAHRLLPLGRFLGARPFGTLVDRRQELERIRFVVDLVLAQSDGDRAMPDPAAKGASRLVILTGEVGIGKTRLAQEVAVVLAEEGFLVATGRCYERDRVVPFYPFLDALTLAYAQAPEAIRSQVSARWPDLTRLLLGHSVSSPVADISIAEQERVIRAIADFLTSLSAVQPVAILLDDLHLADEASLELLRQLAVRTQGTPIFLLATYRDAADSHAEPAALLQVIRDLTREALVERIVLPRFTADETAEMVAVTMGPLEGEADFIDFVYRRTRGTPYFIERMLNALGGHYRLLRQVGAGGMGRVFEAADTRTGRHVAAKLMFARTEADPHALRRFQQEGEVLATLKHPHIVRVYDTFVDEYSSCIVMELLGGQSLAHLLSAQNLSLSRARRMAEQVASALAAAHERGVVHRDIKPDNIMVAQNDHVTVTDFGIARMARTAETAGSMSSTGLTLGTPLYMAPEQIQGTRVDGRADIYSLGAVLYRMVTGRPPFSAADPVALAYQHVHQPPVSPRELNPGLPIAWETLILRALAKNPADRFASAAALEEALHALPGTADAGVPVDTRPVVARPAVPSMSTAAAVGSSPLPRPAVVRTQQRTRVPAIAALIAGGIVVLLLAGIAAGRTFFGSAPASCPTGPQVWGCLGTSTGEFEGPTGAGIDSQNHVWVADFGNHRVQEFSGAGRFLAAYGSPGVGPGQFGEPTDVAVDRHGIVYVADPANGNIQKLTSDGSPLDTLQIYLPSKGQYASLTSVAVDGRNNVYATDYGQNRVRKFSPGGQLLASWGRKGRGSGQLNSPDGIAVDPRGYVYVADKFNDRIDTYTLNGVFLRSMGSPGSGPGQLDQPADLAVDLQGNVYVADTQNHRVQEFNAAGRFVAKWGRKGSGYLRFNKPSGIAVDSSGDIFVTDYYSNHIQKITRGQRG